jgi:hypothetical protein
MTTIKSLEQQFDSFLSLAKDFCLDTTQSKTIPMYFENLDVQAAWCMYTRAYWAGVTDADKERWY